MFDNYILPEKEELIHYRTPVDGAVEYLLLPDEEELVLDLEPIPEILEIGVQGPPGIQGPAGSIGPQGVPGPQGTATTYPYTCGEPISAHRIVILNQNSELEYASCDNVSHRNIILGVSASSGNISEISNVVRVGTMVEPTWAWVQSEQIYLGVDGYITQTPPTSPPLFLLSVGVALSPTSIFINIGLPITLA